MIFLGGNDNPPSDPFSGWAKKDPSVLAEYDGTATFGQIGLTVQFDDKRDVTGIRGTDFIERSYSDSNKPAHYRWEKRPDGKWYGPFCGTNGSSSDPGDSSNMALSTRLESVTQGAVSVWKHWKETEADHPGVDFRTWRKQQIQKAQDTP